MKRYTESHEWISADGEIGTIGISNYAQEELGEIVHVELPEVGKKLKMGDEAAVIESTKAATDLYAPVSGTVIRVNESLQGTPNLINRSAEDKGWLYQLRLDRVAEMEQLLDTRSYEELFKPD